MTSAVAPKADLLLERLEAVGTMTLELSGASSVEAICRESLSVVERVTGASRSAVLLFDAQGVMNFVAWRGLSATYRRAVHGHTPWRPGEAAPEPLLVPDVRREPSLQGLGPTIAAEGIQSMAMFPLVASGGTIGKFMVYHPEPHAYGPEEVQLVRIVAAHVAFAVVRLRAEEALRASEQKYRSVVDHLHEVVFTTDPAGRWTFLSPAWSRVTGFTVDESLGRPYLEFIHPEDRASVSDCLEDDGRAAGAAHVHEVRYLDRAGRAHWVEVHAGLVRGSSGEVVGLSGTLTDVTQARERDEALHLAEERLRESQRLESLGLLAGGIAHDFNNLLMGVLGNAGLARAELPSDSPARSALDDIVLSARRAGDLTRQLLAYSGRGKLHIERLDLSALVRESAQLLAAAISRKATVHSFFAEGLPLVEGDATQLRQVAMNLLTNASDALEGATGTITLRTELVEASRACLDGAFHGSELEPGPYVALGVTDSGCGMEEGTVRRMFDPFFSTKATGRGLGLAVVVGIVRGHRGALRVRTSPGKGTTIQVLLPTAPPPSSASAERASAREGASGADLAVRARVLLVDDEELVRRAAARMLVRARCEVEVAADGRQALQHLLTRRAFVDLVMLDLTMPEMSGEETLALMRARWPDLPVIISSGYVAEPSPQLIDGPTSFLRKPYGPQELESALAEALARPVARPQS